MRFIIFVRATQESEAGRRPEPDLVAEMEEFHDELARANVLLDASGLRPSAAGWRVRYEGPTRTIRDGPFERSNDLVAGYTVIETRSKAEAVEWSRRYPNPAGRGRNSEIEVRQLLEPSDLVPKSMEEASEGQVS